MDIIIEQQYSANKRLIDTRVKSYDMLNLFEIFIGKGKSVEVFGVNSEKNKDEKDSAVTSVLHVFQPGITSSSPKILVKRILYKILPWCVKIILNVNFA